MTLWCTVAKLWCH